MAVDDSPKVESDTNVANASTPCHLAKSAKSKAGTIADTHGAFSVIIILLQ
jgi:hypothetical protein